MGFATVTQVRAIVYTSTLEDSDIQAVIDEVSSNVMDAAGATDSSNKNLIVAGKNAIYAATIRKAIETSEFAARVKRGSSEQQQDLNNLINFYTSEYKLYLNKYLNSSAASATGAFIYGRAGYKTVNNKL
jgi:hypothetical protein